MKLFESPERVVSGSISESKRFSLMRLVIIGVLFSVLFVFLNIRLLRLQLVHSEIYLQQSETNRIRIKEVVPLRGLIYDRNGKLIVDNYPSYSLFATPEQIQKNPDVKDSVLTLMNLESEEFDRRLNAIKGNRYTPVRIKRDIPFQVYARIEEEKENFPGISFSIEPKRAYLNNVAPHTLGHIGELKAEQAKRYPGIKEGEIVGLAGIEKTWNKELIGEKGYEYLEVDVVGRVVGPLKGVDPIPPKPGSDLFLTIDLDLQLYAEELLGNRAGSVVAIEPETGEVLAIASKPDYPPETFANILTEAQWSKLRDDPRTPLLHRAVQGTYPPGSIFKMGVLAAAFETGTIDKSWKATCIGGYQLGNRWFNCWNKGGHGVVNHVHSIESSCDVFYYLLSLKLGIDDFNSQLKKFGFGVPTGIDLHVESRGLLPDRKYFEDRYGKNWSDGLLFNIAIGQGEVLVTPLQAAMYTSALANSGYWITPHLVKSYNTFEEDMVNPQYADRHDIDMKQDVLETVRNDMLYVTEGGAGTAAWLRDPRIKVAGKTGTAQAPQGDDHAWFVAFAPFDDPKIAVAVIVEHGEHGSTAAAPIAFKLIRKHMGLDEAWWANYRAQILAEIRARQEAEGLIEPEAQE